MGGKEGCLFDLETDEREKHDLRSSGPHGDILNALQGMYKQFADTHFQAHFIDGDARREAKQVAIANGNVWSPWQRNLPSKAMTDRKLIGKRLTGGKRDGTKDAQACDDMCDQEDHCAGWQFKGDPGEFDPDAEGKNRCILFKKVWYKSGSIKEVPGFISGIKNAKHIVMKDDEQWVDMNAVADKLTQDVPSARRLRGLPAASTSTLYLL